MESSASENPPRVTPGHRLLYLLTALFTGVLVVSGAVVCVTDASSGCPDWPGCYGRLVPPPQLSSVLEWSHRVVAALALPLLLWTAALGWRRYRAQRWLRWPSTLAIGTLLAVAAFGAAAVLWGLSPILAAMDLGSALITLALVVTAAVVAAAQHRHPDRPVALRFPDRRAQLAPWTLLSVLAVLVTAVLVAEPGSVVRCVSFPRWEPSGTPGAASWPARARLALGAAAALMILGLIVQSWRDHRGLALTLAVLLGAQLVVGAGISALGLTDLALVAYVTVAVALWGALVALVVARGVRASPGEGGP